MKASRSSSAVTTRNCFFLRARARFLRASAPKRAITRGPSAATTSAAAKRSATSHGQLTGSDCSPSSLAGEHPGAGRLAQCVPMLPAESPRTIYLRWERLRLPYNGLLLALTVGWLLLGDDELVLRGPLEVGAVLRRRRGAR